MTKLEQEIELINEVNEILYNKNYNWTEQDITQLKETFNKIQFNNLTKNWILSVTQFPSYINKQSCIFNYKRNLTRDILNCNSIFNRKKDA